MNIVLVDGVRTPFVPSQSVYKDLMAYELLRNALMYDFYYVNTFSV